MGHLIVRAIRAALKATSAPDQAQGPHTPLPLGVGIYTSTTRRKSKPRRIPFAG